MENMNDKRRRGGVTRRGLLRGGTTLAAAAAVAPAAEAAPVSADPPDNGRFDPAYRETDLIRTYYDLARR
ncbi:hypothetical protein [Brevirhabdus sp.]|uniref:hypothetical protein n=1 Tax=Brevirhabdus sp. TaxID=2004514 RepID=UPI004057E5BC